VPFLVLAVHRRSLGFVAPVAAVRRYQPEIESSEQQGWRSREGFDIHPLLDGNGRIDRLLITFSFVSKVSPRGRCFISVTFSRRHRA
jgi:hypothetical protein